MMYCLDVTSIQILTLYFVTYCCISLLNSPSNLVIFHFSSKFFWLHTLSLSDAPVNASYYI